MNRLELEDWINKELHEELARLHKNLKEYERCVNRDLSVYKEASTFRNFSKLCNTIRVGAVSLAKGAAEANARQDYIRDNFFDLCEPDTDEIRKEYINRKTNGNVKIIFADSVDEIDGEEIKKNIRELMIKEVEKKHHTELLKQCKEAEKKNVNFTKED